MPGNADEKVPGAGARSTLALAVIGHVNHGKTALVRALTGIETDRLKEEIERGLSITLGFAWRDYGDVSIDFIDAPGHEDYVRAMVAGTTGARGVLLVVSAAEGFARQTREHLQIATLLGIREGIVALTKADLLTPEALAARKAQVEAELGGTILEGAPIVPCSTLNANGLERLHRSLENLAARCPPPEPLAGAFLPIDRAFTMAGAGTVVTGTLQGGALSTADEAVLWPSGRAVTLRGLQAHGETLAIARAGGRVAVNLRGVAADEVGAGDVLCAGGVFGASLQVDVEIMVLAQAAKPLKHMDQVRVLMGARHDMASVRLFGERVIGPGDRGVAQLQFASPVTAFCGQRGVLRRPSPAETVAGIVVLDARAAPAKGRRDHRPVLEAASAGTLDQIAQALRRRDGAIVSAAELARLSRRPAGEARLFLEKDFTEIERDRWALAADVADASQAYLDLLREAHDRTPARAFVSAAALRTALASRARRNLVAHVEATLAAGGGIRLEAGRVALSGHDPFTSLPTPVLARLRNIEAALREGGVSPLGAADLGADDEEGADLLALLIDTGRAVSLRNVALRQTLIFHREAPAAALARLREAYPPPAQFTTGEARETLGTTRKYIVPLLEHFDTQALTLRRGDSRQVM